MAQVVIHKPTGNSINLNNKTNASVITKAELRHVLLGEQVLQIAVQSSRPLNLDVGDYAEVFGRRYTINAKPLARKQAQDNFTYDITLEVEQYDLLSVAYLDADVNGTIVDGGEFSLTSNLAGFMDVLIYNTRRKYGEVWAVGVCPETDYRNLTFNNENCLAVLQRLCTEFEQEFDIERINGQYLINLRKQGSDLSHTFEYGKGRGLYELTRKAVRDKNPISVLYVFGGTRNLPTSYRNMSRRLKLPNNDASKIEDPQVVEAIGHHEGTVIFDNVYPRRTGTVTALESNYLSFVDSAMDFDLSAKNEDGETLYLLPGTSAKIHFNTGGLAGYEFEVTSYNHQTKAFTIAKFEDERGQVFPEAGSNAFKISVGDKYVILDIRMPQPYIDAAEDELQTKGLQHYDENKGFHTEYELDVDERFIKSLEGSGTLINFFTPGDRIHIRDAQLGVDKAVRLSSYSRDVLNPYRYKIVLSDAVVMSRIERLISQTTESGVAIKQNRLMDPARTRANWRTTSEVASMVDTLRAEVALIGSDEGQFVTDIYFRPNHNGNPNAFQTTAGELVHAVYPLGNPGVWQLSAYDAILTEDVPYYVYARCSKSSQAGSIVLSPTRIGVDEDVNYYHFPLGVLSSVDNNSRVFTSVYGYTLISGNNITTGIIKNDQSGIMINLQTGEIRGAFTFSNGQLIENAVNSKNSRYTQGTDPSVGWSTTEEKAKHIGDIWAKVTEEGIEEYFYAEVETGVYNWVLNETVIDGGRIKTGTIEANRIDVKGLLTTEDLYAKRFHLESGSVGAFQVDASILKAVSSDGNAIFIDPISREITIENRTLNEGVSAVRMKAGTLEPLSNLFNGGGSSYSSTLISAGYSTWRTSDQLRAAGGTNIPAVYIGRLSATNTLVGGSIPGTNNRFTLATNKNYAVDLPYLFVIQHSGDSANGRLHKLHGDLKVTISAVLKGVTAGGTTKDLVSRNITMNINRSDNEIINDEHPATIKASFNSVDCVAAYWVLNINLSGDLTYQRWTTDFLSKYWSTRTDWQIEFQSKAGVGTSFFPSIAVTELTTSGFQTVWAQNRYFRIDGNDQIALIRSAGVWMHNGYEVATANDINTITADLTNYVLWSDLLGGYYTQSQVNTLLNGKANKNGSSTENFTVKDLVIHGTVNHWLGDTITVDDANLQLNRRQGGATVSSGIIIYNKDTQQDASKLEYATDNRWKIDGVNLATEAWVNNQEFARKTQNETVTGTYTFNNGNWNGHIRLKRGAYEPYITVGEIGGLFLNGGEGSSLAVLNGRVGINGITAPTEALHVNGNALISGTINGVASSDWARKSQEETITAALWSFVGADFKNNNATIRISPDAGGAGQPVIRSLNTPLRFGANNRLSDIWIAANGNVGIGIDPSARLHVSGNARIDGLIDSQGLGVIFRVEPRNNQESQDIRFKWDSVTSITVGSFGSYLLTWNNRATSAMYIVTVYKGYNTPFTVSMNRVGGAHDAGYETILNTSTDLELLFKFNITTETHTSNSSRFQVTLLEEFVTARRPTISAENRVSNWVRPEMPINYLGGGRVGIGVKNPTEMLHVSGNILATGTGLFGSDVGGTTTFVPGFTGQGTWRLQTGAETHLTIDRLTVRGRMDIYELVVNQIRGTNGALWVSDSAKVSSVSGNRLTIDTGDSTSLVPFVVNDLLRCQRWTGNNVKYYVVRVTAVGSTFIDVTLVDGSSPREAGDHLVRMGNTTVTARQGAIYLTSSDTNAPYLDVMDGVNSASFAGKTKVRLGRLDGIVDADLGTLSGYGLYAENAFLKGAIVANSGKIGAWEITANYLRSPNQRIHINNQHNRIAVTKAATTTPTTGARVQMHYNNDSDWGFWGSEDGTNPLFRLGSHNQIAGWNFSTIRLWAGAESANDTTPGVELVSLANNQRLSMWRNIGNRILIYSYNNNDWGIKGINGGNTVFSLGSQNLIAGVNFNHQSIWTNRWALNADGSGSFANGKILFTADGGAEIDGSLITQHITTNYIQGLELNFTKGTIGGFKIGTGSLIGGNPNGDRFVLYPDYSGFAAFISADNTKWAGIGSDVLPAGAGGAVGRFDNLESKVLGTNIGLVVRVQNAQRNIAMTGIGDIYMNGEIVGSKHNFYFYTSTSVVILGQFRATWLIQAAANAGSGVSLPRISDVRTELGLSTSTPFAVRVTYIGHRNSSKDITIWGRNTSVSGMSGTEFPQILDNNANNSNGWGLGRGDIQEFMLVFDGVNYSAYLLNYRF